MKFCHNQQFHINVKYCLLTTCFCCYTHPLTFLEILLAHNMKSLAAQAMHELGNLQYHNGKLR